MPLGDRHPITDIEVSTFVVPTDYPESDGTFAWGATTLVVVEASAGGRRGLGYTYADRATAELAHDLLAHVVRGKDAMDIESAFVAMRSAVRNLGKQGIAAMATS